MNKDDIPDSIENHKLGFLISFNTDKGFLEVQKIDDPENFAAEMEYDFTIPELMDDDSAKLLAQSNGYLFTNKEHPYKVTGKLSL